MRGKIARQLRAIALAEQVSKRVVYRLWKSLPSTDKNQLISRIKEYKEYAPRIRRQARAPISPAVSGS